MFAVHTDTAHTHVHFLVSNCNVKDGKSFRRGPAELKEMCRYFGEQCRECGLTYNITRSFYHGLVKHGVRVYEWTPGFCHAKMSVADDCMATCGTINLDYRSLYHHFENGCFMADCQAVVEIKNDLIRTMGECRDVTDQYQTGRSAYLRLGQLFMRLFAGLL